jgi:hypothetical protein
MDSSHRHGCRFCLLLYLEFFAFGSWLVLFLSDQVLNGGLAAGSIFAG